MATIPYLIDIKKIGEEEVNKNKVDTKTKFVIPYKNWRQINKQSSVYEIPIEFCKFRLENGRLKSQVLSHIKTKGALDVDAEDTQKIISKFIEKADPKRNEELQKILKKEGQKEPAVITADGYLINGNRRKWALEKLFKDEQDVKYKFMKVIILPGSDDPERPNQMDLALLENRYQVYVDGKSEYTVMNKALTYRDHVNNGIPLEQLCLNEDC